MEAYTISERKYRQNVNDDDKINQLWSHQQTASLILFDTKSSAIWSEHWWYK